MSLDDSDLKQMGFDVDRQIAYKEEEVDVDLDSLTGGTSASTQRLPSASSPKTASTSTLTIPETVSPDSPSPHSSPGDTGTSFSGAGGAEEGVSDGGPASPVKEKRKRSRVSPEQLVQLESFFAADRSPTASRRKEISELLGMKERQTQVWFQNRRAKAKQMESGRHASKTKTPSLDSHVLEEQADLLPGLYSAPGVDAEMQQMVHEPEDITVIRCEELTIGTWTRNASSSSRFDLVTYFSEKPHKRLTWFIHSGGCSVKMDLPFDIIVDAKFMPTTHNVVKGSLLLSRPPYFFLEETMPSHEGGLMRRWGRCPDWTEGMQASTVLRHDLKGPSGPLSYLWRIISTHLRVSQPSSRIPTPLSVSAGRSASTPSPPVQHSGQLVSKDYMSIPIPQQARGPSYLRLQPPYTHSTIRPIDASPSSSNPSYTNHSQNPYATGSLSISHSHLPQQLSPSTSSPSFSDFSGTSGSVPGDSPQLPFSSSPVLDSSPDLYRQLRSLPPLNVRRSFSGPSTTPPLSASLSVSNIHAAQFQAPSQTDQLDHGGQRLPNVDFWSAG